MRKLRDREPKEIVFNNLEPGFMPKIMAPEFTLMITSLSLEKQLQGSDARVVLENLRGTEQHQRRSYRFNQTGGGWR